jgi:hypothetical protein
LQVKLRYFNLLVVGLLPAVVKSFEDGISGQDGFAEEKGRSFGLLRGLGHSSFLIINIFQFD